VKVGAIIGGRAYCDSILPPEASERPSGTYLRREDSSASDLLAGLARRAADGDAWSQKELLRHLTPPLRRFLAAWLDGGEEVEDALQESLIAVLTGLPGFRGESSVLHFSIAVARRSAQARRRASRRYAIKLARAAQLEMPLLEPIPVEREPQRRRHLAGLLAELPRAQAEALVLHGLLEIPLLEIASETGVSINTVRKRLRLARRSLRCRIEGDARLSELLKRSLR
jgi:RNA polymerase sigma-70 factor (ECF subfamily)